MCWESIKENHIMMALQGHYPSSDDNGYYTWESHLPWGEAETKIKPFTSFTAGSPPKDNSRSPKRKKSTRLTQTFSIKSSLLAVWNEVNIAALEIHVWAEHLVFAECSFCVVVVVVSFICLLRIKTFLKCKDIHGSSL